MAYPSAQNNYPGFQPQGPPVPGQNISSANSGSQGNVGMMGIPPKPGPGVNPQTMYAPPNGQVGGTSVIGSGPPLRTQHNHGHGQNMMQPGSLPLNHNGFPQQQYPSGGQSNVNSANDNRFSGPPTSAQTFHGPRADVGPPVAGQNTGLPNGPASVRPGPPVTSQYPGVPPPRQGPPAQRPMYPPPPSQASLLHSVQGFPQQRMSGSPATSVGGQSLRFPGHQPTPGIQLPQAGEPPPQMAPGPRPTYTPSSTATSSLQDSEPTSRKSSRAPSPVTSPIYDALEGQFTPISQGSTPGYGTPPPAGNGPASGSPGPPGPGAPSQDSKSGITGRRVYPQASNQMNYAGQQQSVGAQQFGGSLSQQFSGPPGQQTTGLFQQNVSGPHRQQFAGPPGPGQQVGGPPGPGQQFGGPPVSGQQFGGPGPGQQFGSLPASGQQYGGPPGPGKQIVGPSGTGQQFGVPSGPGQQFGGPPGAGQQFGATARPQFDGPPSQFGRQPGEQMGRQSLVGPPSGTQARPPHTGFQGGFQQPGFSLPQVGQQNIQRNYPAGLTSGFGQMSLEDPSRAVNLLQERQLILPTGPETPKANLQHDFKKVNCSPEVFRCTLTSIPQTSSLLNKARLPLGILIHPFKDLSQLPVIQSCVIVRCRSCRTYINPFVYFVDTRRWKCNLCYRVNDLPDEFSYDPISKTHGEPQRRPEVRSSTIEFIAPSEYMLRPPQPAVYLFVFDVSFNAVETGYLNVFCETLLDELDKLPGDARTHIGFIAFDRAVHFFNLAEGLSQPQLLTVSDVDDIFLPSPDNLLVNVHESKELVIDLLNQLPTLFEDNQETGNALGAALQAAYKMMSATGGRVTVVQTCLPTAGPGALSAREDPNLRKSKDVQNLGPATDFYKKLALDCSAQQIAVDLFLLNGQYADASTLACISKYSSGCVYSYPSFHAMRNPPQRDRLEADLRRYLTRKIGFEAVMRIRCTKGLSIHTFHGNFFVRSTDLLSLPNINPDAGFGMQMSIEDSLTDSPTVCFQAALLYTSSKGERRIRVHTMCLPVTNQLNEVFGGADQQTIVGLLAKMAADRTVTSSLNDAREAMINAAMDALSAYGSSLTSSQRAGNLMISYSLRLIPLYVLAMLKCLAFRVGSLTKLDDRVLALERCKTLPLYRLMQMIYPDLYPVHALTDENGLNLKEGVIAQPPHLQLSSANLDKHGAFLMDTGDDMYLLVGSAISDQFCQQVFDKPNFMSLENGLNMLPELENPTSERLRNFINYLMDQRPNGVNFTVIRDDSKERGLFFQHMVEDRSESTMSYYEFLQYLQKQLKG
ncbi:protein transport protein Sec24A-like isoform X2 [Liolophura sinensis]|uniref:protein transport protein Sec24A-like isoform X2 n=1 Tax=Liolophura sinensis TaxID=3198878 RepID=UPI0031589903